MSFKEFMIEEAEQELVEYVASKRFKDEEGKPIKWKIRPLTTKENDAIRKQCYIKTQVPGKKGQYTKDFDSAKYLLMVAEKCVVYPNLHDKDLQDFYHVMGIEDLLKEHLLKVPGEYDDFTAKLQEINGYDIEEAVEEAKN